MEEDKEGEVGNREERIFILLSYNSFIRTVPFLANTLDLAVNSNHTDYKVKIWMRAYQKEKVKVTVSVKVIVVGNIINHASSNLFSFQL